MTDLSGLDALIAKLRKSKEFVVRAAPAAAEAMRAALQETADAGTSPDGSAWAPRKKDGAPALANAASKITVRPIGSVLLARIPFPDSLHNDGSATGHVRRQILPSGGIPVRVAEAIKESLIKTWESM